MYLPQGSVWDQFRPELEEMWMDYTHPKPKEEKPQPPLLPV